MVCFAGERGGRQFDIFSRESFFGRVNDQVLAAGLRPKSAKRA